MKHLNPLTKREFLDTIYNYEKHPNEFVYIGKHPSMIIFSSPDNKFCVELEPALEIIAKRRKNHYNVYYVDTVREPELAKP